MGENIFFVPEKARWATVAAAAHTPEIGTVLDEAMREIEAENKSLKNVLPKNYASPDLDKRVLGDVVDLFTNMDMSDTEEGKDLLGRTYEYCIAQFAAYEGVKGGEFYTPSSIVKTIALTHGTNLRTATPLQMIERGVTVASIIKRKTKYSVVYTYTDNAGSKRQKWETCGSYAEAKKRKAEIEYQIDTGVFIPPNASTLSDFLDEYVSLYGVSTWAPSTFDGHKALIENYIKPIIGDVKLDDINPRMITKFYKDLQTVQAVPRYGHPAGELVSPRTIREIHNLLRNAFNQAVKWEIKARYPAQNPTVHKDEKH